MDPREFLKFAETLINEQKPIPAVCRTVIGRSYYAAFNVAVALIEELQIKLDKQKESHKEVMDLIQSSGDPSLKFASDSLSTQKMHRHHADYHMNRTDVDQIQKATLCYLMSKKIIERIDEVRSDPPRWKNAAEKIILHARIAGKIS